MAADARLICKPDDLEEGGRGVRFQVMVRGEVLPAFVVRHGGRVSGYPRLSIRARDDGAAYGE